MSSGISSTVCAAQAVADADPHALEPGQHVELGQRQPLDPRGADREPQRRKVEPAAAARPAGDRAELVAALAQQIAGRVAQLGRETDRRRRASRSPSRFPARCRSRSGRCPGPRRRRPPSPTTTSRTDTCRGRCRAARPARPRTSRCRRARSRRARASRRRRCRDAARPRARGSAPRSRSRRARRRPAPSSSGSSASIWRASCAAKPLGVQQIADAQAGARGLALVGRADPLARWCRWCSRGARRAADRSRGGTAASGARARRRPDLSWRARKPCARNARTSSTSTVGSTTIASPSTQVTPARSTPDGIRRVTYFLPSTTSVWPAFAPPAQRTTTRARSVNRSTILPFAFIAPLRSDDDYDGHVVIPLSDLCAPRFAVRAARGAPAVDSSAPATASTSTAKPTAGLGRP